MLALIYFRIPAYPAILVYPLRHALCRRVSTDVVRALALAARGLAGATDSGIVDGAVSGYQSPEGLGELGKLLDKGGLASMLNTIFLI